MKDPPELNVEQLPRDSASSIRLRAGSNRFARRGTP
jgi:hypothetical protein